MMEALNACLCCLLRSPDKDLSTPYPRLGSTEIYSDMMEYCFQLQLAAGGEGGICEECVGQLRHARDFRLQVECSLARLQAWRGACRPQEDEASGCLPDEGEVGADGTSDGSLSHEEPAPIELETDSEDELHSEMIHGELEEPPGKAETDSGDEAGWEMLPALCARGRRQLAMSCCVRLEQLWGCEPAAREPSPAPRNEHPQGDSSVAEPRRSTLQQRDEPYFCFLCNKRFTAMSDLVVHMTTHTGQKPYSCLVCFKMFAIKSHLTLHTKNHSKNQKLILAVKNSYTCDVCKNKYKNKNSLATHMKIHTGQNIHSSNVCDKLFTEKALLIEHTRVHTGESLRHTCKICERQFSQRNDLIRHVSTHTGRTPYTCDVCGNLFMQQNHLIEHKRVHTGEKPFSCEECNKRFTTKGNLNKHKRSHICNKAVIRLGK